MADKNIISSTSGLGLAAVALGEENLRGEILGSAEQGLRPPLPYEERHSMR